jgi:hypothetical protein
MCDLAWMFNLDYTAFSKSCRADDAHRTALVRELESNPVLSSARSNVSKRGKR